MATTSLLVTNNARKSSTNNAPIVVQIINEHAPPNNSLSAANNNNTEGVVLSFSPSSQPHIIPIIATPVEETPVPGDIVEVLAVASDLSTWNAAVLATGLNLSAEGGSGGFGCGHKFTIFGMVYCILSC